MALVLFGRYYAAVCAAFAYSAEVQQQFQLNTDTDDPSVEEGTPVDHVLLLQIKLEETGIVDLHAFTNLRVPDTIAVPKHASRLELVPAAPSPMPQEMLREFEPATLSRPVWAQPLALQQPVFAQRLPTSEPRQLALAQLPVATNPLYASRAQLPPPWLLGNQVLPSQGSSNIMQVPQRWPGSDQGYDRVMTPSTQALAAGAAAGSSLLPVPNMLQLARDKQLANQSVVVVGINISPVDVVGLIAFLTATMILLVPICIRDIDEDIDTDVARLDQNQSQHTETMTRGFDKPRFQSFLRRLAWAVFFASISLLCAMHRSGVLDEIADMTSAHVFVITLAGFILGIITYAIVKATHVIVKLEQFLCAGVEKAHA